MGVRIGGAFPFGQNLRVVDLPPGGLYYPPAGNYLINLGSCSVLQFWDNLGQQWRGAGWPLSTAVPFQTDGYNWRIVNLSGVVIAASITNAGSGYTNGIGAAATGVSITFGSAPSAGRVPAAQAIVGGAINSSITITAAGSNYAVAPRLVFDEPPPGGIRATADCTINSSGAISAVTLRSAGAGYLTVPNITVEPQQALYSGATYGNVSPFQTVSSIQPVGSGAILTPALTGTGTITGVVFQDYGAGYVGTTTPTITVTGGGSSGALNATPAYCLVSVTLGAGGVGYTGAAPIFLASPGNNVRIVNNQPNQPRMATGSAIVTGDAVSSFIVQDPGFMLTAVPRVVIVNGGAIATTIATGTGVVGGIYDTVILQPAMQ